MPSTENIVKHGISEVMVIGREPIATNLLTNITSNNNLQRLVLPQLLSKIKFKRIK